MKQENKYYFKIKNFLYFYFYFSKCISKIQDKYLLSKFITDMNMFNINMKD